MRNPSLPALLAGVGAVAGCAAPPPPPPAVVATAEVCAGASIDANGDGAVTAAEWTAWRTSGFAFWDTDDDGRIEQDEFRSCYMAGGFYPAAYYDPAHWTYYWSAFDVDGDGFLTADEYWSAQAWVRVDRNRNGIIDSAEWNWWDI